MLNRWHRFNLYLGVLLTIPLCACQSDKSKTKKPLSTIRLHAEMNPDPTGRSETISIFREHPVKLTVSKEPFLTEANVKEAKVIDTPGGFGLSIQFDHQGSWLLEEYSAAGKGKHIAVYCQFMGTLEHTLNQGRWLAAPRIQSHIPDGLFVFTPDATREEAERIALGLNDVASKIQIGEPVKW